MITIKKAKLTSVGYMEIEYSETFYVADEKKTVDVVKKCAYDPHPDLLNTFDQLRIHLALLCEELPKSAYHDEDVDLSAFRVTGFTIGGSDEHEGVTLIGRKALAHNRVLNLIAPFTKWEDEHTGYANAYELQKCIEQCQFEVEEYLGGKMRPSAQQALAFPEDENQAA